MQIAPSIRGLYPLRTLESLTDDLQKFQENGNDLKTAKLHNNVIHERLFNVSLDQMRYFSYATYQMK